MHKYNVELIGADAAALLIHNKKVEVEGHTYDVEDRTTTKSGRQCLVLMGVSVAGVQKLLDLGLHIKCERVTDSETRWEQRFKALEADMQGTLITLAEARNNAREWEQKYRDLHANVARAL